MDRLGQGEEGGGEARWVKPVVIMSCQQGNPDSDLKP